MSFTLLKLFAGSLATIGLYSVLYKENRFYRFWEHLFLGLASGWGLVALWTEVLKNVWWDKMVGSASENGHPGTPGYWAYAFLIPLGMMGYFVFSRRHNWMSRIPIGILLGLYSGQQFNAWKTRYVPQIDASMKPILPTTKEMFQPTIVGLKTPLSPERLSEIKSTVYVSQAISNAIFLVTLLSVIAYFLFSFESRSAFMRRVSSLGRWLLMIGFGAIFGSTVAMRFTLLIDRMYFIWVEFVQRGLLHR